MANAGGEALETAQGQLAIALREMEAGPNGFLPEP
jgi:hypothetical protein